MDQRLALAFVLAAAAACNDASLATPAGPSTTNPPPGNRDGGGDADDPTTTRRPGTLRIAQLNVRRYFDTTCDSGQCDSGGFEEVATEEGFTARTKELATAIAKLEADVLTLAEIETQACLDALKAELKEQGVDYPVAHVAEIGTPGSVDVAVLSRGKLVEVKTHRKETAPLLRPDGSETIFTRELPEVHLTFGQSSVIVFAAHFRSKSDDDPGRRLAEAQKTREVMLAAARADQNALVLLGGDLNDTPGSPPLDALEEEGALVRIGKELPAQSQGTYRYNGQLQAIDHIFTTASGGNAYVAQSTKVVRDDGVGFGGSDHAAIYADFTLP